MADTSDRDELVRLAGEQTLLSKTLCDLNADLQRDLLALLSQSAEIALRADWHSLAGQASRPATANGHGLSEDG